MTDREKLIKLLDAFSTPITLNGERLMDWTLPMAGLRKALADYLLANGVTFANDINVSSWIPVSERLPERGQEVIIYTGNIQKPTVLAYQFWNPKYDTWAHVTHWMPLPTPPEGE